MEFIIMARKRKVNLTKLFPSFETEPSLDVAGEKALETFVDNTSGFEMVEDDNDVVALARGETQNIFVRYDSDEEGTLLFQAIYETYLPKRQIVTEYMDSPEAAVTALSELVTASPVKNTPQNKDAATKAVKVKRTKKPKKGKEVEASGEEEAKPRRKRKRKTAEATV